MKHKRRVILLLSLAILTEVVGAVLNHIVTSANGGMPLLGLTAEFGKWVPLNPQTKFPLLADIIHIGPYIASVGDLLFITGMATCIITIWIAMPQGRKLVPLLIASISGIILSTPLPNNMVLIFLCETVAIATILAICLKYRTTPKIENDLSSPDS